MAYDQTNRFSPPEYGLLPEETVLWQQSGGTPFMIFYCGVCLPLSSVFIIPFIAAYIGETIASGYALFSLMILLYTVARYINIRRTQYYLTTNRIIETRGGRIVEEISRESLRERNPREFFQAKEDYGSGGGAIYRIRFYNIELGKLIEFHGIRDWDLEKIRKIMQL
ncbi:hypothetical protein EU537_00680 [Candidatus Thorarchaeota archaeon]|nr:MAG: hypothetical protein EU537_00680 [Candidatus Thorarchaeota archaeon]